MANEITTLGRHYGTGHASVDVWNPSDARTGTLHDNADAYVQLRDAERQVLATIYSDDPKGLATILRTAADDIDAALGLARY